MASSYQRYAGIPEIYIVGPTDGPFKIGRTNNLVRRVADLQSGSPVKLYIHFNKECRHRDAADVEWWAHQQLAACHVWGEWFGCALSRAKEVVLDAMDHAPKKPDRARSMEQQAMVMLRKSSGMTRREWKDRNKTEVIESWSEPQNVAPDAA